LYLLVASYNDEKAELLSKIEKDYARELDAEPMIAKFVKKMLTYELMVMDEKEIESQLAAYEPFQEQTKNNKQHMRDCCR